MGGVPNFVLLWKREGILFLLLDGKMSDFAVLVMWSSDMKNCHHFQDGQKAQMKMCALQACSSIRLGVVEEGAVFRRRKAAPFLAMHILMSAIFDDDVYHTWNKPVSSSYMEATTT